jgi:uncharacterized protein
MPESVRVPAGPREVLARFQQAAIERSLTSMVDLYAEDAIHEFPFTRPGVPSRLQGREQIRTFMQANWETNPLRYKAYRNVVIYETADPEVIVVEQDVTGTAATTSRDFTLPNIVVLRVRDGQIVHFRDYVNVVAVAEAAGRQLSA